MLKAQYFEFLIIPFTITNIFLIVTILLKKRDNLTLNTEMCAKSWERLIGSFIDYLIVILLPMITYLAEVFQDMVTAIDILHSINM